MPPFCDLKGCRGDWLAGGITASESRRRPGNVDTFASQGILLESPVPIAIKARTLDTPSLEDSHFRFRGETTESGTAVINKNSGSAGLQQFIPSCQEEFSIKRNFDSASAGADLHRHKFIFPIDEIRFRQNLLAVIIAGSSKMRAPG